jgi:spermidine/putrescine transport system substrate-binding protein
MSERPDLPLDLLRGLALPRMSRRRFLQAGGLTVAGATLAACSLPGTPRSNLGLQGAREEIAKYWAAQTQHGQLNFANWPLYMDVDADDESKHPSLDEFTKKTGIKVKYDEVINDTDEFYNKIAPVLRQKQSLEWDLMVLTNGMSLNDLMIRDYLVPLDQARMSNFYANASTLAANPSYDRGNVYTMAWQSGITGIAYDIKRVGHEITSWEDLQDPKLRGKIGMFGDNEDLPGCALAAIGVNPEQSTPEDWKKAADWLIKQKPLVRKYYAQDYVDPLLRGDIWATMGWSGDVLANQGDNPNLRFVVPKEGAVLWTDNMCIPAAARNPLDAMIYMDYVYNPDVAATLADYIWYITPVPAVQGIFVQEAKDADNEDDKAYYQDLSTNPLMFPKEADFAKLHRYRVLSEEERPVWNALFQPIYSG